MTSPLLHVFYINDWDENAHGMIDKFADDSRIGGVVDNDNVITAGP